MKKKNRIYKYKLNVKKEDVLRYIEDITMKKSLRNYFIPYIFRKKFKYFYYQIEDYIVIEKMHHYIRNLCKKLIIEIKNNEEGCEIECFIYDKIIEKSDTKQIKIILILFIIILTFISLLTLAGPLGFNFIFFIILFMLSAVLILFLLQRFLWHVLYKNDDKKLLEFKDEMIKHLGMISS